MRCFPPLRLLSLLALSACTQSTGFQTPKDDVGDSGGDSGDSGDSGGDSGDSGGDSGDSGGRVDADGDGFSVEEGDCDDDNVYVSPARDEDPSDGLDNDCDGRFDEEWYGFDVAYLNDDGPSAIMTLDSVGREQGTVILDDGVAPMVLDYRDPADPDGGWYGLTGYASVASIEPDGTATELANFEKSEACTDFTGVYGMATGPDGTLYVTTLDKLWSVGAGGELTELASWGCSLADPEAHEFAAFSLAVDPASGEVGLFGYLGGFATWSPTAGFDLALPEDLAGYGMLISAGAHRDQGGWYALGATKAGYGLHRYVEGAWVEEQPWEEDWTPAVLAMDGGDDGDFYLSANGGWYYTVWRVARDSGYTARLYSTDGETPNRAFVGLVTRYTFGE